ncbi:hypothetical protein ACIQKE_35600 [Streptomyces griseoviridis]
MLDITVPADSSLEFTLDSADLKARGRPASLMVDTGPGEVEGQHVAGNVRLDLAPGDTELGTVDGCLTLPPVPVYYAWTTRPGRSSARRPVHAFGHHRTRLPPFCILGDVRIDTVRGSFVVAAMPSGDACVGADKTWASGRACGSTVAARQLPCTPNFEITTESSSDHCLR